MHLKCFPGDTGEQVDMGPIEIQSSFALGLSEDLFLQECRQQSTSQGQLGSVDVTWKVLWTKSLLKMAVRVACKSL